MTSTHVAILQCGEAIPGSAPRHGDYDTMCKTMMGLDAKEAQTYRVLDGVFPGDIHDHSVYVITGSKFGVYEDHSWIAPLEDFIRTIKAAGKILIGVCFGHQIIAQALGGCVEKSTKGFGIGLMPYKLDLHAGETQQAKLYAWHQDQVISVPPGATVIASSDFCPVAGLQYGESILTFQAHPEFTADYERVLIAARRGTIIPHDQAEAGEASLMAPSDSAAVCDIIRRFAGL